MVAVVMEPHMRCTKDWSGVVGAKLGSCSTWMCRPMGHPAFTSGVQQLAKEMRKRAGTDTPQPQGAAAPASAADPFSAVLAASKMSEGTPAAGERSTALAALPLEVPMLPEAAVQRPGSSPH